MQTRRRNLAQGALALTFLMMALSSSAQAVRAERIQASPPSPRITLQEGTGNFFVFSSDVPFRVEKADPAVGWFTLKPVEGERTPHRVIALQVADNLPPPGVYFSSVRVRLTRAPGLDEILIPVVLSLPARPGERTAEDLLLEAIPAWASDLQLRDPNVQLRTVLTPGGHYIVELVDRVRERFELDRLINSLPVATPGTSPGEVTETYALVLPWMCLEYPCGRSTTADIADVAPNLDAVNAVSYERYTMSRGVWRVYNVGDPGPWAKQVGLGSWPMLTGGYQPSYEDVLAMWTNRAAIGDRMIAEADARSYQGYCVDVEGWADSRTKDLFVALLDYFADRLHGAGRSLMVAHATWSTIAPIRDLAATSVDYVATMDPYTSAWYTYIPRDYAAIEPGRLVWGFTWDRMAGSTQQRMWTWMDQSGYNQGVAGAAAWRTPLMPPHPDNELNYYQAFRDYYPADKNGPACPNEPLSTPDDRWKLEIWDNRGFSGGTVEQRYDAVGSGGFNFNWGTGGPSKCAGADDFAVRFSRNAQFPVDGTYTFTTTTDDGVRLWVDDVLVIDRWVDMPPTSHKADVHLTSGWHRLRMDYYERGGGALAALTWALTRTDRNDAAILEAESVVPASLAPGETRPVTVRVRNTGGTTWRAGSGHRLGAASGNGFVWGGFECGGYAVNPGDARVFLCRDVPPGGTYDFTFQVTAPGEASGSLDLSVRMVQEGVEWFGEDHAWHVDVQAGGTNDAAILEAESVVPASLAPGETRPVTVRVRNTGGTTWRAGSGHRLGAASGNGFVWGGFECGGYAVNPGDARVFLCRDVPPGGTYDFTFQVTAPGKASDSVGFSVRMVQEGVEWFGESFTWRVAVGNGNGNQAAILEAESVVPASLAPGETRPVTVRVRNTGDTTWRVGSLHRLGAALGNGFVWGGFECGGYAVNPADARVFLCRDVPPGGTYDFTFQITAPSKASGSVGFSVRMVQDGVEWFGETFTWRVEVNGTVNP